MQISTRVPMQIHADLYVHKSLYLVHTSMYPFCTSSPHRVLKMQLCAKVIKVCVWVSAPSTLWTSKWEKECTCKCYYHVYVCVWAWSIQRSCLHERRNFCMKEVTSPQYAWESLHRWVCPLLCVCTSSCKSMSDCIHSWTEKVNVKEWV